MAKMTKVLALVAHDNMKRDLAEWVDWNSRNLSRHHLVCTGTTGKMVERHCGITARKTNPRMGSGNCPT